MLTDENYENFIFKPNNLGLNHSNSVNHKTVRHLITVRSGEKKNGSL
jgi:hypothetical protein